MKTSSGFTTTLMGRADVREGEPILLFLKDEDRAPHKWQKEGPWDRCVFCGVTGKRNNRRKKCRIRTRFNALVRTQGRAT